MNKHIGLFSLSQLVLIYTNSIKRRLMASLPIFVQDIRNCQIDPNCNIESSRHDTFSNNTIHTYMCAHCCAECRLLQLRCSRTFWVPHHWCVAWQLWWVWWLESWHSGDSPDSAGILREDMRAGGDPHFHQHDKTRGLDKCLKLDPFALILCGWIQLFRFAWCVLCPVTFKTPLESDMCEEIGLRNPQSGLKPETKGLVVS